ncbi:hypothetical protein KI387_006627 [Taxus chinensis]|uniref:Uncharacterized protein n=1 Tax=Taxus chinensis TaxID=29808 RepID=A0AA38LJM1_TAXCH|nr:hypothetical protein KI387_006627 [Taxus chinensis]
MFRKFQCSGNHVDENLVERRHSSPGVMLEIYVLGDNMSYLKTIHLNGQAGNLSDLDLLDMKFTSFGSQNQLLLYIPTDALGVISSHVLKTALAREVVQLKQVSHNNARELEREETGIVGSCPYLGYIYHIFEKFATTPTLFPDYKKCITFKVVLESSRSAPCYGEECIKYLEALIRQLKAVPAEEQTPVKMGMWVRKLVCLVPVQIARAENNAMDFHLDKDTESAFSRFQNGINLLKQDKNLFKGLFYIAIKDVDTSQSKWHQKRLSNQSEVMKSKAIMNANNNDQKHPKLEDFLGGAFLGVQFSDDAETHHIHTSELDQIYGKAPAPAFSRDLDHSSAMNTSIVGDHMHVNGFSDLTSDSSKHSQYQSDQGHASTAMQDIYNNNGDQAYKMFSKCSLQLSQSSVNNYNYRQELSDFSLICMIKMHIKLEALTY